MRRDGMVNAALAIIRVVTGVIFLAHGWQKVFQFGLPGITAGFTEMGIPLSGIVAPGVAILELVGGIALILGILTRVFGVLFAIDMLGAMFFVHFAAGFFLPQGYEFTLILFATSVALALTGGGDWSVDHAITSRRRRTEPDAGV